MNRPRRATLFDERDCSSFYGQLRYHLERDYPDEVLPRGRLREVVADELKTPAGRGLFAAACGTGVFTTRYEATKHTRMSDCTVADIVRDVLAEEGVLGNAAFAVDFGTRITQLAIDRVHAAIRSNLGMPERPAGEGSDVDIPVGQVRGSRYAVLPSRSRQEQSSTWATCAYAACDLEWHLAKVRSAWLLWLCVELHSRPTLPQSEFSVLHVVPCRSTSSASAIWCCCGFREDQLSRRPWTTCVQCYVQTS